MELRPAEPQPVNHFMRLAILVGLFGATWLLSQLILFLMLLPSIDISNLDPSHLIDYSDPEILPLLKAGQVMAALFSFILPAWLYTRFTGQSFWSCSGMNKRPPFSVSLLVPLLMISALPFIAWTAEINKLVPLPGILLELEREAEEITRIFLAGTSVSDLFVNTLIVAVTAAVAEEIFFRGILQNLLMQWTGRVHVAVWVAAAVFSFIHFQFHGFLPRMLLGAVMGYMLAWTGSLWIPILAHFINNFLGVLLNFLVQKGKLEAEVETYGSEVSDWPGIAAGTVIMLLIILWIRKITSSSARSGNLPHQ